LTIIFTSESITSMPSTISFRDSIRWIPDEASEPTDTVVLTGGKTGVFLDARFIKGSEELDWAFAGYRSTVIAEGKELIKFTHLIDSRTKDPSQMTDYGSNTELPDGTTLEKGEMVNPATGKMTSYEEIWRDETFDDGALFLRNVSSTIWYARIGSWQLALGRDFSGNFWAFQAHLLDLKWTTVHSTSGAVKLLPDDTSNWVEGKEVQWNGDQWLILEKA